MISVHHARGLHSAALYATKPVKPVSAVQFGSDPQSVDMWTASQLLLKLMQGITFDLNQIVQGQIREWYPQLDTTYPISYRQGWGRKSKTYDRNNELYFENLRQVFPDDGGKTSRTYAKVMEGF